MMRHHFKNPNCSGLLKRQGNNSGFSIEFVRLSNLVEPQPGILLVRYHKGHGGWINNIKISGEGQLQLDDSNLDSIIQWTRRVKRRDQPEE